MRKRSSDSEGQVLSNLPNFDNELPLLNVDFLFL